MIELGSKVKDTISGFIGIATGRCTYLNGCVQIQIEGTGTTEKGTWIRPSIWSDEQRVQLVHGDAFKAEPTTARTGGPVDHEPPQDPT